MNWCAHLKSTTRCTEMICCFPASLQWLQIWQSYTVCDLNVTNDLHWESYRSRCNSGVNFPTPHELRKSVIVGDTIRTPVIGHPTYHTDVAYLVNTRQHWTTWCQRKRKKVSAINVICKVCRGTVGRLEVRRQQFRPEVGTRSRAANPSDLVW